jgi:uncharacterized protein (TIGR04255 family)
LKDNLPKFANPPLVEAVLGVQFNPLPHFSNAHLGAFWKRLGSGWTAVEDAVPIDPQFERFGGSGEWTQLGLQLRVIPVPVIRLQIRNTARDRMIQVQNGRLHYNWVKHEGGDYPHYRTLRPEFDRVLDEFRRFLVDEKLGELQPNQWEVTYVNQLLQGTLWKDLSDFDGVFRIEPVLEPNLPGVKLSGFGGEWHYDILPQKGRLHVQVLNGRLASPEAPEMLGLTLTARGPVGEDSDAEAPSLDHGLDLGHEKVVQAFHDLTTEKAHKFWGLIHDPT